MGITQIPSNNQIQSITNQIGTDTNTTNEQLQSIITLLTSKKFNNGHNLNNLNTTKSICIRGPR